MKKLITRTITGIVLVLFILTAILASQYSFALLFLLILIGGLIEFANLYKQSDIEPNNWLSYPISVVLFVTSYFIANGSIGPEYFFVMFPLFLMIMTAELYRKKSKPIENMAVTIFIIIYMAVPLAFVNFLVFPEILPGHNYSPSLLIALFALIWTHDSGAYLFGITMGKHKLFERISPKKSWEGSIGGTFTAIIAAVIISHYIPEIQLIHWIAISILAVISSTFGDLTESMFKRYFQIKDSGNIFPGHGGILDRFDSILFAVPIVVLYLKLIIE